MIKIQLSSTRRLTSDENQFIIQKITGTRKSKDSDEREPNWESVSYHVSVLSALQSFGESAVRGSDATTLKELIEVVKDTRSHIDTLLHGTDFNLGDASK